MGSFLGMKMDQYWMDLFMWEKFLNEHDIHLLVEFGTGHGGMSTYLALQCAQRNIRFVTIDNINSVPFDGPVPSLLHLREAFQNKDAFSDETQGIVRSLLDSAQRPACLFFDDGDKPREWKTYAPAAYVGDFLAVHDWQTEFRAEHIVGKARLLQQSEPRTAYKTAWFVKEA